MSTENIFDLNRTSKKVLNEVDRKNYDAAFATLEADKAMELANIAKQKAEAIRQANGAESKIALIAEIEKDAVKKVKEDYADKIHDLKEQYFKTEEKILDAKTTGQTIGIGVKDAIVHNRGAQLIGGFLSVFKPKKDK